MVKSMQQIDVVIPTWNSNAWYFPMVINSVIDALNLHHLVVIDRFSNDGTQETLKRYGGNILRLIELDADLAIARKIGGLVADTEIVCYVDDDWLVHILKVFEKSPRIGAVQPLIYWYQYPDRVQSKGLHADLIGNYKDNVFNAKAILAPFGAAYVARARASGASSS
jgi:glycosyltransferase involved in cell wall biosynthesis